MTRDRTRRAAQIAYALSVVGDRWTLLLLCELRLGVQRFEEIRSHTGMSSHLLRNRLRRMEADGVIERRQYHARPPRYAYVATAMGQDLDMVLLALHRWGRKWGEPVALQADAHTYAWVLARHCPAPARQAAAPEACDRLWQELDGGAGQDPGATEQSASLDDRRS
ncbi:helix-turn-helix domain-containing protein [Rugamonas sp.]|uniref:winged helix-turn-helix transcriptional regulator n=1 Tax=Rugamonas sp. TaxID=1926287 RepID=UPI0025F0440E|nr:helix-turn-helix domain-containing protein [Rugamonas sp.]